MCLVCSVGVRVIEHRVHDRDKRLQPDESRKDRAVSGFAVKDESGSLRHLQQMKIGGVRADARFNNDRTRAFEQLIRIKLGHLCRNLRGDLPVLKTLAFAQPGIGERIPRNLAQDIPIACGRTNRFSA